MNKLLITSEEELRGLTGVSVALTIENLSPHLSFSRAEDAIIHVLGDTLYENLVTAYADDGFTSEPELEKLLPYVQKPLANLAVYHYMQEGGIHISNEGVTTNRDKAAFQWQHEKGENFYLDTAYDGLDRLIKFLLVNKSDYPNWDGSAYHAAEQGALLNSADALQRYVNISTSYRTYRALLPVLLNCEDIFIRPLLGDTLIDAIKTEVKDDNASADHKLLLKRIEPALAFLTMGEGLEDLNMEVTGDGAFRYSLRTNVGNIREKQAPETADLTRAAERFRAKGQGWLKDLREYLDQNASPTKYASYYNSPQYTAPGASNTYTQNEDSNVWNGL